MVSHPCALRGAVAPTPAARCGVSGEQAVCLGHGWEIPQATGLPSGLLCSAEATAAIPRAHTWCRSRRHAGPTDARLGAAGEPVWAGGETGSEDQTAEGRLR